MRLFELGVELLHQGYYGVGGDMSVDYLFSGILQTLGLDLDIAGFNNKYCDSDTKYPAMRIVTHLLKKFVERVGNPKESVEHISYAIVELGDYNRQRGGFIVLTQDRLFSVGQELIATKTYSEQNYLWYPDLTQKSYYGSMDYIPYSKMTGTKLKFGRSDKKLEVYLQDIEYFKVKPRHLLGPLFFKIQLSDKTIRKRGIFQLNVRLLELKDESKNDLENRYVRLEKLIRSKINPLYSE